MGREYRLSGDARLRQESDRRDARVSPVVWRGYGGPRAGGIAGIDAGEDFLDCAWLGPQSHRLIHARIDVRTLGGCDSAIVLGALAERFRDALPGFGPGALALIDSPRWPRDLDCAAAGICPRSGEIRGREIDHALRHLIEQTARLQNRTVPMFPTPLSGYFYAQIAGPSCKPHLRALGIAIFGTAPHGKAPYGGSFTRFMLTGFATYRALEQLGVSCFESYPDLQFRVWNGGRPLPSKSKGSRSAALEARNDLVAALAGRLNVNSGERALTLDEADAAILALSAAAAPRVGDAVTIEHPAEGRFWLTLPKDDGLL